MEKIIYESRPYVYLALALWVFFKMHDSYLALFSGISLVCCGVYVVVLRHKFRQQFGEK
jgi:hypothetical protein